MQIEVSERRMGWGGGYQTPSLKIWNSSSSSHLPAAQLCVTYLDGRIHFPAATKDRYLHSEVCKQLHPLHQDHTQCASMGTWARNLKKTWQIPLK